MLELPEKACASASASEADPATKRWAGTAGVAIVAVLGLITVVTGVLAGTAFGQLKSLKAHVSATSDELTLAKERTASLERQLEQAMQRIDQQLARLAEQPQGNDSKEARGDRPSFQLTRDETLLIRSYIKASPVSEETTGTINVGGKLPNSPLLPLPAQIAEKAPRLAGSRFTIDRNGAIIISLRKSRQADAVIQPN